MFTRLEQIPRHCPYSLVCTDIFQIPRFLYRLVKDGRFDFQVDRNRHLRIPILLAAGDNAELFIRDTRSDSNYEVLAYLKREIVVRISIISEFWGHLMRFQIL